MIGVCNCVYAKSKDKQELQTTILDDINFNWWLNFQDLNLTKYVIRTLSGNSDLNMARSRIKQYGEYVKASFGAELPTVSTTFAHYNLGGLQTPVKQMVENHGMNMPLTLSYEVDLFGKNRNKTQAAKKQLEAYSQSMKMANMNAVSATATLYFNVIKVNKILELYNNILTNRNIILKDYQEKLKYNLVSQIDVDSVKQDIIDIEVSINQLKQTKMSLLTQLCVLIGENPTNIANLEFSKLEDLGFEKMIKFSSISSDAIFERPDVLASELELEKAKIDVKVARKEFLPTINLSGNLIFGDFASGGFFSSANTIKMLVASVGAPLFTGGRKMTNLRMNKYKQEELLEQYKKTTLNATKELNDILYILFADMDVFQKYTQNLIIEYKNLEKYQDMQKNGLISFSDYKKAEQKIFVAEMNKVQAQIQVYIDFITLYKATGGKFDYLK